MFTTVFSRGLRHVGQAFLVAGLCGAVALGCGQDEGDRCEVDSDCGSGLMCDLTASSNNGICRQIGSRTNTPTPDAGQPDAAPIPTVPTADAAIDLREAGPTTPDAVAPSPDAPAAEVSDASADLGG